MGLKRWLGEHVSGWLVKERRSLSTPLCDFERLRYELRPGDVLLVEGCSRVADVIKVITQSTWSHAALYVGRLHDIDEPERRDRLSDYCAGEPDDQLLIEAILGKGTVVTPLRHYATDNLRVCRPRGLSRQHAQAVLGYAIDSLGSDYDVRHLLDLARFLFPYGFIPRRWRSSLFEHNAGIPTRTVCSAMLASAFMSVRFPILPVIEHREDGQIHLYQRNPRRFTPRDFDYSPYFDIIKYPYVGVDVESIYQQLPWNQDGVVCNDPGDCFIPRGHPAAASTPPADAAKPPSAAVPAITVHRFNLLRHRRSFGSSVARSQSAEHAS